MARSIAASATSPRMGAAITISTRLRLSVPGSSITVATAVPALTRITPPTPAPMRAEPSTIASTMPAQAIVSGRATAAHGGVERRRHRGEDEHGKPRLQLVADPIEARAEGRAWARAASASTAVCRRAHRRSRRPPLTTAGTSGARGHGMSQVGECAERKASGHDQSEFDRATRLESGRDQYGGWSPQQRDRSDSHRPCGSLTAVRVPDGQPRGYEQQRPGERQPSQRWQPARIDHDQPRLQCAQARRRRRRRRAVQACRACRRVSRSPRWSRIVGPMSIAAIMPR